MSILKEFYLGPTIKRVERSLVFKVIHDVFETWPYVEVFFLLLSKYTQRVLLGPTIKRVERSFVFKIIHFVCLYLLETLAIR